MKRLWVWLFGVSGNGFVELVAFATTMLAVIVVVLASLLAGGLLGCAVWKLVTRLLSFS